ncbi:MAG: host-nuclease inhibitor Gam family protein [bacterium]|nr:host-nuclease inhibitor Gam family protein [bacterium]
MDNEKPTKKEIEKIAKRVVKLAKQKVDLTAEYEGKVLEINQEYAAKIEALTQKIDADTAAISTWAIQNPEEFASSKTLVIAGVEVAYKDGVPKVQILEKWDEKKVLDTLSKAGQDRYIRIKKTLNRTAILNDFKSADVSNKELKKYGLEVVKAPSVTVDVQKALTKN